MGFRDIVVVGIVLVLALWAIRRPWIGVMNWTWLSIMNPHRYTWGFAFSAPLAAIAAASTLLGLIITKERRSPFHGAPTIWFLLFTAWITISWRMGYDPNGDYYQWTKVMKIFFMTYVALMLLMSKQHIVVFVWVTIGSIGLLAVKGGLFTILSGGGYHVWGPAGSFIADNNAFALAVIVCTPMLYFLQTQLPKPWMRFAMTLAIIMCIASALGSQSRGAFVALTAAGGVFWWRSPNKGVATIIIFVALIVLLPMMPDSWWQRMDTIDSYEEDGSAMGRINAWLVAIEVAKHHFFGAGMSYQHQEFFSQWGVHETTTRAAHSIYFQVLGNHGFIGLFLYLMIFISAFRMAGRLRKQTKEIPQAKWVSDMCGMIQVSLLSFAVGGAFLSLTYFDLPYNLMVMVVLASTWVRERAWETEAPMQFAVFNKKAGRGLRRI